MRSKERACVHSTSKYRAVVRGARVSAHSNTEPNAPQSSRATPCTRLPVSWGAISDSAAGSHSARLAASVVVSGCGSRFRACGAGSARSDATVAPPEAALGRRASLRVRPSCSGGELALRKRFAATATLATMRAVLDGLRMALRLVTVRFPMLCLLTTWKVT